MVKLGKIGPPGQVMSGEKGELKVPFVGFLLPPRVLMMKERQKRITLNYEPLHKGQPPKICCG
jgi:hypothetical protein